MKEVCPLACPLTVFGFCFTSTLNRYILVHISQISEKEQFEDITMSGKKPDITFFNLGASRAIRTGWILEELNLPYNLVSSARAPNGLAPPEFRQKIIDAGGPLGKSPTIVDGDVVVQESGAIAEYVSHADF